MATEEEKTSMSEKTESRRVRGFYRASRSYYFPLVHKDGVEEFMIGVYLIDPENGTKGEFGIRQVDLGSSKAWRLEIFDDAWPLLGEFQDLIDWLSGLDKDSASAQQIRCGLVALGMEDLTTEKDSYGESRLDEEERKLKARLAEIAAARVAPTPTKDPR